MELKENCIEWVNGDDRITLTLNQQRMISKVKKMAEKHPDLADYHENHDGSVLAHLPLKALKLSIITGRAGHFAKKEEESEDEDDV